MRKVQDKMVGVVPECRRAGRTRVRLDPQMEDKNKELYCTWTNTCETRLHMVVS